MFRAEVVGSMLRPKYLKDARQALERGTITPRQFKDSEDRAVDQVIAMQEGAGTDVVTDGEMRRFVFLGPISEAVEGIEPVPGGTPMPWFSAEGAADFTFPAAITGKLKKLRSVVCEEYSYARGRARKPLKVTVPSALSMFGLWDPKYSSAAYQDPFEMFADCAEIGRSEVQELVSLGCEYVQIDAPELATLIDPRVREWTDAMGMPADRMLA
ncbi:MAG TPA: methionine synthase, partial [Candidatus Methylomirabilis sp.]|nr:methionine synthase [Candidatus Methylomirabilis sp.]